MGNAISFSCGKLCDNFTCCKTQSAQNNEILSDMIISHTRKLEKRKRIRYHDINNIQTILKLTNLDKNYKSYVIPHIERQIKDFGGSNDIIHFETTAQGILQKWDKNFTVVCGIQDDEKELTHKNACFWLKNICDVDNNQALVFYIFDLWSRCMRNNNIFSAVFQIKSNQQLYCVYVHVQPVLDLNNNVSYRKGVMYTISPKIYSLISV